MLKFKVSLLPPTVWTMLAGSTNREVEKQAVEDRLAWLEQVINDRNMGFSITGSSPEDDADGAAALQAKRPLAKAVEAHGEELACLLAGVTSHTALCAASGMHIVILPALCDQCWSKLSMHLGFVVQSFSLLTRIAHEGRTALLPQPWQATLPWSHQWQGLLKWRLSSSPMESCRLSPPLNVQQINHIKSGHQQ